jgi:hypothetical protein
MRMTTTMSMPASAGIGARSTGMRIERLTVRSSVPTTPAPVKLQKEKRRLLPFRTRVTILAEAMTGKRSTSIALGLLLPR